VAERRAVDLDEDDAEPAGDVFHQRRLAVTGRRDDEQQAHQVGALGVAGGADLLGEVVADEREIDSSMSWLRTNDVSTFGLNSSSRSFGGFRHEPLTSAATSEKPAHPVADQIQFAARMLGESCRRSAKAFSLPLLTRWRSNAATS
jgi:hypothetical protein